jgi:hypothetical protein
MVAPNDRLFPAITTAKPERTFVHPVEFKNNQSAKSLVGEIYEAVTAGGKIKGSHQKNSLGSMVVRPGRESRASSGSFHCSRHGGREYSHVA